MTDFERELLGVLREALMLNEPPADFTAQSNLFQTFGLDSVDALEIMMVIKREYGIGFSPVDEQNKKIFMSIGELAAYVTRKRSA